MNALPSGLCIREAQTDDIDDLCRLYERVFGRPISRAKWEWKLGRRGHVANVWIATHQGRIVFQYAGVPTRFWHRGAEVEAMVSVDTITDPDYRRRGLLGTVAAATYAEWAKAGVPFVVGLPNEQWGSRAEALGWKPIAELRWWVRWIDPVGLAAARLGWTRRPRPRRSNGAAVGETRLIQRAEEVASLWPHLAGDGVIRDGAWYARRYLSDVPSWEVMGLWRSGDLVGATALRLETRASVVSGVIGEVAGVDRAARRDLLRAASRRLRDLGALRAAVLLPWASPMEEAALETGYLPRPSTFRVQAVDLGGHRPWAAQFQGGDFDVV